MQNPAVTEHQQLIDQFLESLRHLPGVNVRVVQVFPEPPRLPGALPTPRYDVKCNLRVAGKIVTLLIEVKKVLYPRDVRQTLWQIKDFSRGRANSPEGRETVPVLIAESISPGAKEILKSERVGYYDSGGSLYVPAEGVYLYLDRPLPKPLSKSIRSLFSGRRAQVLHTLLVHYGEWYQVKELADDARVSPATASQVLSELERYEWVVSRGMGPNKERHLIEPAALLDAWVKQHAALPAPPMRRFFVPSVRAEGLVEKIAHVFAALDTDYAITHEAAAQRYAPFLSSVSRGHCRLSAGQLAEQALRELDARAVNEGMNLGVIEARSFGELLFRNRLDGVWLASPIQVYLDLTHGEGRTEELADHLRRERIGF